MTGREEIEAWVFQARQGNVKAKEKLLHQFKPLLLKNIMKYFGMNQDMEDWLQEGRRVILEAIENYDGSLGVPFSAYVQKQVFYYFVNERKRKKEEVILDQPSKEGKGCLMDVIGEKRNRVEEYVLQKENKRNLQQAIQSLSHKQQRVIFSYYIEGKTLKDMAQENKLCYQSLVKLKGRALEKMRRELVKKI